MCTTKLIPLSTSCTEVLGRRTVLQPSDLYLLRCPASAVISLVSSAQVLLLLFLVLQVFIIRAKFEES